MSGKEMPDVGSVSCVSGQEFTDTGRMGWYWIDLVSSKEGIVYF